VGPSRARRAFSEALACGDQLRHDEVRAKSSAASAPLNITTWSAASVGGLFAIIDFLDPAPHAWRVGLINVVGAIALSAVPLLHRFGSTVGPVAFASIIYVNIFLACSLIGTDTGMQMQFLAVAAATILFLGADHRRLIALFSLTAVILIVAYKFMSRTIPDCFQPARSSAILCLAFP
jgi:hypothetical protein